MIDFSGSLQNMITRSACIFFIIPISFIITGCDNRHAATQITMNDNYSALNLHPDDDNDAGNKLFDLAGQASVPSGKNQIYTEKISLPNSALPYIGRYHVHIRCSDAFAHCTDQDEVIDYILNLLANGSAYCQRVSLGRLKYDDHDIASIFRRGYWSFNEELKEISIALNHDGRLYYQVNKNKDLVLNLNKTLNRENGLNHLPAGQKYIFPDRAYTLVRLTTP